MVTEEVGGPFERIAVDLIGPLPRTDDQMVYLLVCQDYFTKWVEAIPIPNKVSKTVADAFVKGWVCRFGSPKLMYQYNGAEFTSELLKRVCSLLDVQ